LTVETQGEPGDLSAPGENDIRYSIFANGNRERFICEQCANRPYYDSARAFNAHLERCHPRPRRLVLASEFRICIR
jgi:hypothetical protein